ncbi:MAG: HDOD domain-containing protein [Gammaproteobacteria bacterium]|nr:HDOD domain-containing protein [Gammaproteobacteria bacterium]
MSNFNIPKTVATYLATSHTPYQIRRGQAAASMVDTAISLGIAPNKLIQGTVLKCGSAYLMAIYPANAELDIESINRRAKREFKLCTGAELKDVFPNCEPSALPPVSQAYGVHAILDQSIYQLKDVFFSSGKAGVFCSSLGRDFIDLHVDSWHGDITSSDKVAFSYRSDLRIPDEVLKQTIESVDKLPAMPWIAAELLKRRNNPYIKASTLAEIIEKDPSLSAQLIRYASSPLYAYQGKLESVEQAIIRVLGLDFVMDLAFGLSLGKSLRMTSDGPLGLKAFWNHAIYCASLTQMLCNTIEPIRRPPPGMGYLAALIHNFGFLLLGHLFPTQFKYLNNIAEKFPDQDISDLESEILGTGHNQMGQWLMKSWKMPEEIIEAVTYHHDPEHNSDYSNYASLIYIANCLLKRHGIGDANTTELPPELLFRFGFDEQQLLALVDSVMDNHDDLDFIANKMAA